MSEAVTANPLSKLNNVVSDVVVEAGVAAEEKTSPYWVILDASCPLPNVAFGGVTFHKKTELGGKDGTSATIPGQLLWLSDRQVQLCRDELLTRVLRIYYETGPDGKRQRRGQQDIACKMWHRPGIGQDGKPFLNPQDGKPLTAPVLIKTTYYQPNVNDVPFTRYVKLQRITEDLLPYIQAVMGLEVTKQFLDESLNPLADITAGNPFAVGVEVHDKLSEAKAYNEVEAEKEQSLGAEAGVSKRARRGTTMGREE
jgi:hypothetical protein